MESRPTARREIGALTGIRFAAACLVLVSHTAYILGTDFPSLAPHATALTVGDIGVGVFFFLSGYILTYTYAGEFDRMTLAGWLAFMRRRFARVWPMQTATLLALVAVAIAARVTGGAGLASLNIESTYSALPSQLTLTHAWLPWSTNEVVPWNSPSWSISAEWFAYLLAPLMILLLLRMRVSLGAVLAIAMVTSQFVLWKLLLIDSGITRIFGIFFLGGFCYLAVERTHFRLPRPDLLVAVVCIALLPALNPTFNTPSRFFVILASGILIVPLAQSHGPISRFLGSRHMRFWGRASFAVYMTHWPIVQLYERVLVRPSIIASSLFVRFAGVATMYVTILAVGALAYVFVERPLEKRLRRPWSLDRRDIAHAELGDAGKTVTPAAAPLPAHATVEEA